jgi:hypothetical protein
MMELVGAALSAFEMAPRWPSETFSLRGLALLADNW